MGLGTFQSWPAAEEGGMGMGDPSSYKDCIDSSVTGG